MRSCDTLQQAVAVESVVPVDIDVLNPLSLLQDVKLKFAEDWEG